MGIFDKFGSRGKMNREIKNAEWEGVEEGSKRAEQAQKEHNERKAEMQKEAQESELRDQNETLDNCLGMLERINTEVSDETIDQLKVTELAKNIQKIVDEQIYYYERENHVGHLRDSIVFFNVAPQDGGYLLDHSVRQSKEIAAIQQYLETGELPEHMQTLMDQITSGERVPGQESHMQQFTKYLMEGFFGYAEEELQKVVDAQNKKREIRNTLQATGGLSIAADTKDVGAMSFPHAEGGLSEPEEK